MTSKPLLAWGLASIALANIKSLPGIYTLKFGVLILQEYLFHTSNENLWFTSEYSSSVLIDDVDFNMHMNNASYAKHLDFARAQYLMRFFPRQILRKFTLANAGVLQFFKVEVKPFKKFTIRTQLLSCTPKWFFVISKFESRDINGNIVLHCIALTKFVFKTKEGKTVSYRNVVEEAGIQIGKLDELQLTEGRKVIENLLASESIADQILKSRL